GEPVPTVKEIADHILSKEAKSIVEERKKICESVESVPTSTEIGEKHVSSKTSAPIFYKTFIINLGRRSDRCDKLVVQLSHVDLDQYERFEAVDGKKIQRTEQLFRIFDTSDYHMRRGMVGCALSHLRLLTQLIYDEQASYYLIM